MNCTIQKNPHYVNMPGRSLADAAVQAAINLFFALRNPHLTLPIAHLRDTQLLAIDQLTKIFRLSTSAAPSTETTTLSLLSLSVSYPIPRPPFVPQPVKIPA